MINQIDRPVSGETYAVIKTNMGEISVRLFPNEAPKTVENFVKHSNDGYYNGIIFHRVIENFMIQGGDPTGTGRGGESIWGRGFEDEIHPDLHNLRGALSMANTGMPFSNGSQFFIVQAKEVSDDLISQMKQIPEMFSEQVIENYSNMGGTPWLDGKHTVFGQVFEGMDVVDTIAGVKVDMLDKPYDDVVIETIEIKTAE